MPKKCIGKKVKFTPINSKKNWASLIKELLLRPTTTGHHTVIPIIIVNTAPILKT
jgi:hypothetical protein